MKRKFVDHTKGQKVDPQIQEEIGAFEGSVFRLASDYNYCAAKKQNELIFKRSFTMRDDTCDIAHETIQNLDLKYNQGLWGVLTRCFKN